LGEERQQLGATEEGVEAWVVGAEVLGAAEDPFTARVDFLVGLLVEGLGKGGLPDLIGHPGDAWLSGEIVDFASPGLEGLCPLGVQGVSDDEEAVVVERGDLIFRKLRRALRHNGCRFLAANLIS
jgi:hypothetical protein